MKKLAIAITIILTGCASFYAKKPDIRKQCKNSQNVNISANFKILNFMRNQNVLLTEKMNGSSEKIYFKDFKNDFSSSSLIFINDLESNKKTSKAIDLNFVLTETENVFDDLWYWSSIFTLGVIPYLKTYKMELNVDTYEGEKFKKQVGPYKSDYFYVNSLLILPLSPFFQQIDAIVSTRRDLVRMFLNEVECKEL